jgi:hypothetical protein
MEVMAGFIIGFDSDPLDIDRHLIRFIQDSGIPVAMTGLLTALPGSPLYDRFKAEGRLLETGTDREGDNTFQFAFNFKTVQDEAGLIAAYKNVLLQVYGTPKNYFRRVETLFRNLRGRPAARQRLTRRRLSALLRSLLKVPFSRYGWSYGAFLLRTLWRHPERLSLAVRQGIIGVHFHQVTHDRLAAHEFGCFVGAAIERVREAYASGRQEGPKIAAQVLADGRRRLKELPSTVRDEMRALHEELELTLRAYAVSWETT